MAITYASYGAVIRENTNKYVINGVQIGNQIWSDRNLDIVFDELQFNVNAATFTNQVPVAYYINAAQRKQYGLLYNYFAIKYINDNANKYIPGWHIATASDCDTLFSYIGGISQAYTKLRSIFWSAGNDSYLFSALPGGYGYGDSVNRYSEEINLGTSTSTSSTKYKVYWFNSTDYNSFNHSNILATTVRLVKDTV